MGVKRGQKQDCPAFVGLTVHHRLEEPDALLDAQVSPDKAVVSYLRICIMSE